MFSGSLVALVTPMRPNGEIDFDAWANLLDFHMQNGTTGIVVGGTTGEASTITDIELRELTLRAVKQVRTRMIVVAGAGLNSTVGTVARVRWVCELGVSGLLIVTPSYNKPTQEGLYQHYAAAAAAASVPVLLYNVPGRTAVDMLPATVARLSCLPNIAGIKEAVADVDRIRDLIAQTHTFAQDFTVLSGDDRTARKAVLAGARGIISVTANVAPQAMSDMIAAALMGDVARAEAIDSTLAELHECLFFEANPIPVKWALERMGLMDGGIRLPLLPLSQSFQAGVLAGMRRAGLQIKQLV